MRELPGRDSADPVVAVSNLSRSFGTKKALDDVTLAVSRGCVFGLVDRHGLQRPQRPDRATGSGG